MTNDRNIEMAAKLLRRAGYRHEAELLLKTHHSQNGNNDGAHPTVVPENLDNNE